MDLAGSSCHFNLIQIWLFALVGQFQNSVTRAWFELDLCYGLLLFTCCYGDPTGYFGLLLFVGGGGDCFGTFFGGQIVKTPLVLAEMGDSLLSEPTLTAEPAPSPAATPTPAAAEPGVSLAPPTSTAAATSPGAANTDLLGGQWASRKFSATESLWEAQPYKTITRYDSTKMTACSRTSTYVDRTLLI